MKDIADIYLAKQMWKAYANAAGGLSYDGKPLPGWDQLGNDRQDCWIAAARRSKELLA